MSERTLYWRGKLAELESSGLSRAAFCRRHRINYQTMTSWVKRLRDEGGPASGKGGSLSGRGGSVSGRSIAVSGNRDAVGFVEVSLPAANALAAQGPAGSALAADAPAEYEVRLGGGRSIRVGGDFDDAVLARLIRVVESC